VLRLMRLTREERREERFGRTVVRSNATKSPTNNKCASSVVCKMSHCLLWAIASISRRAHRATH
jgi:hypothetical protein